jgi:hypothetical protein
MESGILVKPRIQETRKQRRPNEIMGLQRTEEEKGKQTDEHLPNRQKGEHLVCNAVGTKC